MKKPSSRVIACWVRESLFGTEWQQLKDVCQIAIQSRIPTYGDTFVSEIVEENIYYVAEILRNDIAESGVDGAACSFEIDDEDPPYIRVLPRGLIRTLSTIRSIDPFKFERLCAEILTRIGALTEVTSRTNDGGVDFIGYNMSLVTGPISVPTCCRVCVLGQAKRYNEHKIISETNLREFVGAAMRKRNDLVIQQKVAALSPIILAFWTTSSFDRNAKTYARAMGLWYMDGETLANYVETLQCDLESFIA